MEITLTHEAKATILSLSGSIDATNADSLMSALMGQIEEGNTWLVADFRQVDYISSAGLRALLGPLKQIRQQGGELCLAGVQEDVLKVLKLSGFTTILKTYPDVQTALASFSAGGK